MTIQDIFKQGREIRGFTSRLGLETYLRDCGLNVSRETLRRIETEPLKVRPATIIDIMQVAHFPKEDQKRVRDLYIKEYVKENFGEKSAIVLTPEDLRFVFDTMILILGVPKEKSEDLWPQVEQAISTLSIRGNHI